MRVAVIGCGSAGRRHIGNLIELGCEVFPFDVSEEALARVRREHPGAQDGYPPHYCFLDSLEYDAVVVATPWDQHLLLAQDAVRNGIALFVEKPLGTVGELQDWRELARVAAPLATMTGYQCRFHPAARAMRAALPPADLGVFRTQVDTRTWPGQAYGPLLLEASHDLDLALSLGAPARVTDATVGDAYASVQLGEFWTVTIDDHREYLREWGIGSGRQTMAYSAQSPEALGTLMYYDAMQHFVECVREHRQTDCPLSDGVRVLEICAQVEQLARQAA